MRQSSQTGRGSAKLGTRTEDLVRKADIAALPALGVGQGGVVLRKLLLAFVPLVESGWVWAAF